MSLRGFLLSAAVLVGCSNPRSSDVHLIEASVSTNPIPVGLDRLGNHHFKVTTKSRAAQQAFNRGLTLAYSFGHYAAEQQFRRAAQADPECAMAQWGIALVNGPHINFPLVPPEKARVAWEAISRANQLSARATRLEQKLISALSRRYANPQPKDRGPLDNAYAEAMGKLWNAYPNNPDVGTLYAESLMDLHPWDLWKDEAPQPWTPRIVAVLEKVLSIDPRHPGANHYYIHAIEASPEPEKALRSAYRLGKLVPDSGHMIHMPSHIFARVGDWARAAESNMRAMDADFRYRGSYPRLGFYALYMAHNSHFLGFTAMMRGRSEEAIRIARQMVSEVPPDFIQDYAAVVDGFTVFVPEVLMRFGRWEEILAEPPPPQGMPLAKALWHYTRTAALTALSRTNEAALEHAKFKEAAERVPEDATFGNNRSRDLIEIAALVIQGEIEAQSGRMDAAVELLGKGVVLEDKLRYDEPPDWVQPVRHTLGAVLLRKGDAAVAEAVYREDLRKLPNNGWALMGLRDALRMQRKVEESQQVDRAFRKAWASADVRPSATCYCQGKDLAAQ